jgi:transposase
MEKQPNIPLESKEENLLLLEQLEAERKGYLDEISRLTATIVENNDTIADLKFQIAEFKRLFFGSKRERFISNEHPSQLTLPFDFGDDKVEPVVAPVKEEITYERNKPSKPHPGRFALPSHLPVEEIIIEPTEDVTGMTFIGYKESSELEYIPGTLTIKRRKLAVYLTKEDETGAQREVKASLDRPIPKCIAGPGLLSHVMVEKFLYHMPLHRQIQRFKQEDVHIPASTMDSWFSLCSQHIRPLFAVHKLYILENPYLQVDESPIKVQDRDKPGATHQGYMWVYRAPMQNAIFFDYHKGRGLDAPMKNLSIYKGYLQTDGYAVYEHFGRKQEVTHLACWAHARRMFDKALDNDQTRASTVLKWIQQLYAIERNAMEDGLDYHARHELRLDQALPVLNDIGKYIANQNKQVLPKSLIGKAFEYCIHRWDNLLNYLKDGNLEIDNNGIENAIRGLALGRKNYLFAGSHSAAEDIGMYYSFFGTCKKHDINPQKWLEYVINHINDTKMSQLKYLLPQFIDKSLIN